MDELYFGYYIQLPEFSPYESLIGSIGEFGSTTGSGTGIVSTGVGSVDAELDETVSPQEVVSDGVDPFGASRVSIS